eukprot:COSAG02_NODE_58094_length_278_cov_1.000000_1_plen_22_part_01
MYWLELIHSFQYSVYGTIISYS